MAGDDNPGKKLFGKHIMNLLEAYQKLKILSPLFVTKEAAMVLGVSHAYTSMILSRLAKQKTVIPLTRARWAYSDSVDPLLLPNILAHPMKAYISLYSALYYRGLIDQIPSTVFAITNGKTKLFETPLGTISLHSINGFLFTDYEMIGKEGLFMATAEKALFDTLYLAPAKSHIFTRLTELDIPEHFCFSSFSPWLKKIKNKSRRAMVEKALKLILTKPLTQ